MKVTTFFSVIYCCLAELHFNQFVEYIQHKRTFRGNIYFSVISQDFRSAFRNGFAPFRFLTPFPHRPSQRLWNCACLL
jgi:hypothetical protein